MSFRIADQAWACRSVEGPTKTVLVRAACFVADDGTGFFASVARVAADCGLCERTVQRAIAELVSVGLLELVAESDPVRHRAREYRIVTEALVAPPAPDKSAPGVRVTPGDRESP